MNHSTQPSSVDTQPLGVDTKPSGVDTENSDTTAPATRSRLSAGVRRVIARRAASAGLSEGDYFREIIAGRAPRITRLEAAREPLP